MSLLDNPYVLGTGCFTAGSLLGYWLLRWKERNLRAALKIQEDSILDTARRQAETITREARLQANEDALKQREATEQSFAERRHGLIEAEKRLVEREALINHQLESMVQEEKCLREQQQEWQKKNDALGTQRSELDELIAQRRGELVTVAHLSEADARGQLLKEVELEALQDASHLTRRILDEAKGRAEEKARRIISLAIQRYAGEHTFESSSATIALPGEEIKGRIIGREGRKIGRAHV